MLSKIKEYAGVVALLAIILTWVVPQADNLGATGTRFLNGLSTDSTSPSAGQVRSTTLLSTGNASFATTSASQMLNVGQGSATTTIDLGKACFRVTSDGNTVTYLRLTSIAGAGNTTFATTTASCF
jgi:hypothetical protein